MYLGIDIGTSAVKAIVQSEDGEVRAEHSASLKISHPGPRMSEQSPDDWWIAVNEAVRGLGKIVSQVRGIGLSGQMHGAVLLNDRGDPLRPAILWNDGRADRECVDLEHAIDVRGLTGNCAMPGFTAPKINWVRSHEPHVYKETAHVVLPKDFVRLRMTGDYATDMSDASGTLWLEVGERQWSPAMLEATGLTTDHMPSLFEGSDVTGVLRNDVAEEWKMARVPVVGGAGDQAAGAVGCGAVVAGRGFLSLGTSGVVFVPDRHYRPNPDEGVHAFCHALPELWHQMAVILSAAGSLTWISQLLGAASEGDLLLEIEDAGVEPGSLYFLPYLSGERTPHNDANATGAFVGLTAASTRTELGYAVIEGVAFALRECRDVLVNAGADLSSLNVISGGSRSLYWGQLLANVLQQPLVYRRDAAVGPALGAARLAQLGTTGAAVNAVCTESPIHAHIEPEPDSAEYLNERFLQFQGLYHDLKSRFPHLN